MPFLIGIHGDPSDFQRWTPAKFDLVLREAGFKKIEIIAMGGLFAVVYDLLRMSLGTASKNRKSIKVKVINRLLMPILQRIFIYLDNLYDYKNKYITTGYFVKTKKL